MSRLSYTECEIDTGALIGHKEAFQELHAKISGRSGEFGTIAQPVSVHFEGLVGEGLKTVATQNQEAWSSAMMACIHAYGVVQKVIEDVKWYEDEIEAIKLALTVALGSMPSTGDDDDDASLQAAIVEEHNGQAREAWQKLETKCEDTEEQLREGPTPGNIQELIAAGYIGGDIAYYTTGDVDYFYYEESDAITMANFFKTAAEGYEGSLDALDSQVALLNALVLRALTAQQKGEELSDNEIEFLEALFAELQIEENQVGQLNGESTPQDFLTFIETLNNSEHIDGQTKGDINRNLANTMLFLSDEDLGGGMEKLPQDVRDLMEIPDFPGVNSLNHDSDLPGFMDDYSDWGVPFATLSTFLDSAGPGVQGGTEFSTTLMGAVAATLEIPYFAGEPSDEHFQTIIEVASRNEEANHIIITGEDFEGNAFQHHESHGDLTPEKILETFYTHSWEDGGAAVGGITDWISSYKEHGTDEEQDHAGFAAHALIEILTAEDDEGNNVFRDTGNKGGGDYELAVTEINPALAESLASVYLSYLDDFSIDTSDSGYEEVGGDREDLYLFHENGDKALLLPNEMRQDFLQLLVANEELSPNIIAATESQERRIIEAFLTHPNVGDRVGGEAAADLRTMLDNALIQEYVDRKQTIDEARNSANNQWQTGYNVFTAVATGLGGGYSNPVGIGAEVIIKILEQPMKDYVGDLVNENIQFDYIEDLEQRFMESDAEIRNHANLQLLDVMVGMELIDMETLEEEGVLIQEEDGTMRLPATTADWSTGASGYMSAVEKIIASTSFENDGRVDAYVRDFMEFYGPDLYRERMEED
ncbi:MULTISPECIES: hypothetical protein [unclassified Nocardiopsis]|uniref:TPR repeat region-containing protein n=1 Tax=unclassified Nocardiopsis TaxID=2649073 RepID=UPI0013594AA2|nr:MULTISPECIES: hypothetical protein [unclassified Nocardiopsis]